MYAKIEQQRLNYIKTNQQKIRVDLYSGLADAVAKGDTNATQFATEYYSTLELYQLSVANVPTLSGRNDNSEEIW